MAIEIAPEDIKPPESRNVRHTQRTLLRLGAWGGATAIALATLAITTQTEGGSERIQALIARATSFDPTTFKVDIAKAEAPPRVVGINQDTVRLEAQLRVLTADRDRLAARLATIEHNLDDMTGSIKKQAAALPPKSPAPAVIAPLAMPVATEPASWPGSTPLQSAAATAQAQEPAPVPLPPVRIATATPTEHIEEAPRKSELGIDLGGASTLDVLNARWVAVKANFGPLLTGLSPLAAHNLRQGVTDYRLVVGPLPNAAAAANLCARFAAAKVNCRTTKFDGERIAQR
jgi:hypothetical protein